METGQHQEVNLILRQYKDETGLVKFESVLSIPTSERIPQLAKNDFKRILMLTIGAVTMAFKSLNQKNGLNEIQILDLSEAIIDTANEDNLSFEDLMLFLQKLVRGEYDIGETMNIPKFMKIFEVYREKRWQELNRIREEQHVQFKSFGNMGKNTVTDALSEHFASLGSRLSEMKHSIQHLRDENKNLKMDSF